MADGPAAHEITVVEALQLLDTKFKSSVQAIANGYFAFWIGSGFSRDRFPMLDELIVRVLEFIRLRIELPNPTCEYRVAFNEAISMAELEEEQRESIDFSQAVNDWPAIKTIKRRLSSRYADFLNIRVGGQPNDFLVWDGIDVVGTYGDSTVDPDTEHLCLAALVLEGAVSEIASANWDGLIEKAYAELAGNVDGLAVCVASTQLQDQGNKPKLVKFHGCAPSARDDPDRFRALIVARSAQLSDWGSQDRSGMKTHLTALIGERRTLMLGLSAQDFDIQHLFREARDKLSWTWNEADPAYLFSEDRLGATQDDLLENVYRGQYDGSSRQDIAERSVIRAFAKALLLAMLLEVYSIKFITLAARANLSGLNDLHLIELGLTTIRNMVAKADTGNSVERTALTRTIVSQLTKFKSVLTSGRYDSSSLSYIPISSATPESMKTSAEIPSSGLPEASVALGLLGWGHMKDAWTLSAGEKTSRACVTVTKIDSAIPIILVANATAASRLFVDGAIDEQTSAVLIHSQERPERMVRGRSAFERTGKPSLREVGMQEILAQNPSEVELFERFRQEASL